MRTTKNGNSDDRKNRHNTITRNGLDENIQTNNQKKTTAENNRSEREKVFNKFPDLFENNEAIKDTEIKIQLKPGHYPVKQKARPVPLHLQKNVERELERLKKSGHLVKVNNVDKDCFASPVVRTDLRKPDLRKHHLNHITKETENRITEYF